MATDPEPLDAFAAQTKAFARSQWRQLLDRGRVWLTGHLLLLATGAIGGGAAAIALLPIFAGVVCAVVAITAVIVAIFSRRLMADERAKRRYAFVQGKRIQQRELRAQMTIDNAILAIGGDRSAGFSPGRNAELMQALRHLQAKSAQARNASRPQPLNAAQHAPAIPPGPDLARVRQRMTGRKAEIDALEAEIQSLVAPGDTELQGDARAQREAEKELTAAVREADRIARDRRRRGQPPTAPPGSTTSMQVLIGPEGVRQVKPTEPSPTPEQITTNALSLRPPPR